jgi:4-amino-4-deoxychorismate lyase
VNARWLVNGAAVGVDPADRGLAYGDGVFETMAAVGGTIARLALHLERLDESLTRLAIPCPPRAELEREIATLCPAHGRAVVKLIVTRGSGVRGYAPPPEPRPTRIVSVASWPDYPQQYYRDGIAVHVCALRLGINPALAGLKHLGRLEYVMAHLELRGLGVQQGLLLDTAGLVVGGSSSNVFVAKDGKLVTPAVARCGVSGVMRRAVLAESRELGLHAEERELTLAELLAADEIFMTNAIFGIWPVASVDSQQFVVGPVAQRLLARFGCARGD